MERLKIEKIANNYGMHLQDFAKRKVLADQINLIDGSEYINLERRTLLSFHVFFKKYIFRLEINKMVPNCLMLFTFFHGSVLV